MDIKKSLTNKSVLFYVGLLAIPFALVTVIEGIAVPGFAAKTFNPAITILLILGIVSQIASVFFTYGFMPLIPVVFYAAGFAVVAYCGMPIVMDMINKINFMNGDWTAVKIYIIFTALACVFAVIPAFAETVRKNKKESADV